MREKATLDYSPKRLIRFILLNLQSSRFIPSPLRQRIVKLGGVKLRGKSFMGSGICFDTLRPDLISIGSGCVITSGVKIISHFYEPEKHAMFYDKVVIGDGVFIGMNTLIVKSVEIGDNAVIGAGSVVVDDIPADEIWAGNPAKFIRKRGDKI